jgi:hypothetical protein
MGWVVANNNVAALLPWLFAMTLSLFLSFSLHSSTPTTTTQCWYAHLHYRGFTELGHRGGAEIRPIRGSFQTVPRIHIWGYLMTFLPLMSSVNPPHGTYLLTYTTMALARRPRGWPLSIMASPIVGSIGRKSGPPSLAWPGLGWDGLPMRQASV